MTMPAPSPKSFPLARIHAEHQLDRQADKRGDEAWIAARLNDPESRFFLLADLKVAVDGTPDHSETEVRWCSAADIKALGVLEKDILFLGCDPNGRAVFGAWLTRHQIPSVAGGPDALRPLVDLRTLAMQGALGDDDLSLVATARALTAWHDRHRCCGRCGGHTVSQDAGWRRVCWACKQDHFPRMDPAVIVLITDGARCLLGQHRRYAHKFYSTLAGFVEPGEDIETCVRREIGEETGITIGDVTYLGSQPWPFPHSLMIGCWAEALTTELTLDPEELVDARWFTREEVIDMLAERHAEGLTVPGPHSIACMLIQSFVENGAA